MKPTKRRRCNGTAQGEQYVKREIPNRTVKENNMIAITGDEKIKFFGSGILASIKLVKEYSSYIEELRDEIYKTIENTDSRRHFEGELMKTIDKRDRVYKVIGCLVEDIHDLENGNER